MIKPQKKLHIKLILNFLPMSEEILSQSEGISSDGLDEGTVLNNESTETVETETTQPKTNKKSNVEKLLAERNKLRKENEQLKAGGQDIDLSAEVQKALQQIESNKKTEVEKTELIQNFWEEKFADIQAKIDEKQGAITPKEAAILLWLEVKQQNPNKFSFAGNTPQTIKKPKTISDVSDADLLEWVKAELAGLGYGRL